MKSILTAYLLTFLACAALLTIAAHAGPVPGDLWARPRNYERWAKLFGKNPVIRYHATDGKEGHPAAHLSHALPDGGIYTFRSGWDVNATVMVLKASPPAFWHSQPDNGTFELYINGTNFFPDVGCNVYGGNEDEAAGPAEGDVAIHFGLKEGEVKLLPGTHGAQTLYPGPVSYAYRQKQERTALSVKSHKDREPVRFVTVILTTDQTKEENLPLVEAKILDVAPDRLRVQVTIDQKNYYPAYHLKPKKDE